MMTKDREIQIGVGLIGPSGIGQAHAHAYTLIPRVLRPAAAAPRLLRVCGRQTSRAEVTRARYGFEHAGDRWPDLVSDHGIQLVDNCALVQRYGSSGDRGGRDDGGGQGGPG